LGLGNEKVETCFNRFAHHLSFIFFLFDYIINRVSHQIDRLNSKTVRLIQSIIKSQVK
jgi:hypothetical protein